VAIEEFLKSQGFSQDQLNTVDNGTSGRTGFIKDKQVCSITGEFSDIVEEDIVESTDINVDVSCGILKD
jgi:hypothetical protein